MKLLETAEESIIDFFENLQERILSLSEQLGLVWWLEIITDNPQCIYYFGPFATAKEAKQSKSGYIEDLEQENAKIISVNLKYGQPEKLTLFGDEFPDKLDTSTSTPKQDICFFR